MIARLVATLTITAGLSLPAAAAPAKGELLDLANRAIGICAQSMPDVTATGDALKAAGFSFKEADGDYKAYAAKDFRVAVLITRAGSQYDACSIMVSKMTPAEGAQLIAPWLQQTGAKPLDDMSGKGQRWLGIANDRPLILGVIDNIDIGIVRGAAVLAGRNKR